MSSPLLSPTKETHMGVCSSPRSSSASPNPFPKRPIPTALGRMSSSSTESDAFFSDDPASATAISYSDSHSYPAFLAHHSSPSASHPISLLTALLAGSSCNAVTVPERIPSASAATTSTAAPSTVPSPISSAGWHGKTAPILRRGSASASSDGAGAFGQQDTHGLGFECGLEKVVEKRERIGWADVETAIAPFVPKARACTLKFAVTCAGDKDVPTGSRRSSLSATRPSTSFADTPLVAAAVDADEDLDEEEEEDDDDDDDDEDDDEEDEEDEHLNRIPSTRSSRRSSIEADDDALDDDLGYQEDEEDGFTSEDEPVAVAPPRRMSCSILIPDASQRTVALPKTPKSSPVLGHASANPNFPFARPTNYRRKRPTPDKVSAPSLLPPPERRGRGHIQVVDASERKTACSRHCSPPPVARSAAPPAGQSPSARKLFSRRLTSESPRKAGSGSRRRVGSPMPPKLELEVDDEEEAEMVPVQAPARRTGGWRSDDALFTPSLRPVPFQPTRKASLPPTIERPSPDSIVPHPHEVRSIFRRASVHIPTSAILEPTSLTPKAQNAILSLPSSAIDDTPATCTLSTSLGVAERLHRTLATQSASAAGATGASVARAASLGSRVAFAPAPMTTQPMACSKRDGAGRRRPQASE